MVLRPPARRLLNAWIMPVPVSMHEPIRMIGNAHVTKRCAVSADPGAFELLTTFPGIQRNIRSNLLTADAALASPGHHLRGNCLKIREISAEMLFADKLPKFARNVKPDV
jgi:hypothetical protein